MTLLEEGIFSMKYLASNLKLPQTSELLTFRNLLLNRIILQKVGNPLQQFKFTHQLYYVEAV